MPTMNSTPSISRKPEKAVSKNPLPVMSFWGMYRTPQAISPPNTPYIASPAAKVTATITAIGSSRFQAWGLGPSASCSAPASQTSSRLCSRR